MIGTDCTGSCRFNYHTITTSPKVSYRLVRYFFVVDCLSLNIISIKQCFLTVELHYVLVNVLVKKKSSFIGCTSNSNVTYTDEDIAKMVLELKKNLTIDYKSTSAYYRSKNSARDDRKSSSYVGTVWMVALCTVMGIIILSDCVGLTRHMRNYNSMFRQN